MVMSTKSPATLKTCLGPLAVQHYILDPQLQLLVDLVCGIGRKHDPMISIKLSDSDVVVFQLFSGHLCLAVGRMAYTVLETSSEKERAGKGRNAAGFGDFYERDQSEGHHDAGGQTTPNLLASSSFLVPVTMIA